MHSIFAFGFTCRSSLVCSSILAALLAYFSSPTQVLRSLVLMCPNLLFCCISVLLLEGFLYCSASCRSYFMLACERDVSASFSRYTCFGCCGGGVARRALRHFCIYVRSQRMRLYLLRYNSNCGVQLCSDLVAVGRFLTSAHANPQRLPSEP